MDLKALYPSASLGPRLHGLSPRLPSKHGNGGASRPAPGRLPRATDEAPYQQQPRSPEPRSRDRLAGPEQRAANKWGPCEGSRFTCRSSSAGWRGRRPSPPPRGPPRTRIPRTAAGSANAPRSRRRCERRPRPRRPGPTPRRESLARGCPPPCGAGEAESRSGGRGGDLPRWRFGWGGEGEAWYRDARQFFFAGRHADDCLSSAARPRP